MCGIYACIGDGCATNKVLQGLKRIEYRGYDSWGIASCDQELAIEKHVGKISLVKELQIAPSTIAIGHTRWATHGGVTQANAHPHLSSRGHFALVQNGVVENYQELKKALLNNNYHFKTQTDTEVIVALLEQENPQEINLEGFVRTIRQLAGRNTILALEKNGSVWAYRQGSPLIIGKNEQGVYFFSSDLASLSHDANVYYVVQNQQIAHLKEGKLTISQLDKQLTHSISFQKLNQQALDVDKGNFPHFMRKEIYEQPESLLKVLLESQNLFAKIAKKIDSASNIYVVGAGSASYAALHTVLALRAVKQQIFHMPAYDYADFVKNFSKKDVAIVLSQSGETADTIEAVEALQAKGVFIISAVNMPGSTLMNDANIAYPLNVGAEIGVASTKALTAHILFGMALTDYLLHRDFRFQTKVKQFSEALSSWLNNAQIQAHIKQIAHMLSTKNNLYILGRGANVPSALEFALKIKEVSYIHAEGFSAGELKHGVIALIEKDTPVVCLVDEHNRQAMLSSAHEVKARGARVIGIAVQNEEVFDAHIQLPSQDFSILGSIIIAQLLTYEIACLKKLDPDKPRNLAKSVTVK